MSQNNKLKKKKLPHMATLIKKSDIVKMVEKFKNLFLNFKKQVSKFDVHAQYVRRCEP